MCMYAYRYTNQIHCGNLIGYRLHTEFRNDNFILRVLGGGGGGAAISESRLIPEG